MARTLFYYVTFIPWTLFVIATGVPLSFINPDYLHNYCRIWARFGLWLAGVRIQVQGLEHLLPGKTVVYMANHQSQFDILALFAGIPGQFRWIAKEELFHIPLFGLAMRRTGYIPLDRSNNKKAMKSMIEASRRISDGTSVVVFPEGTRSPDGTLLPFKKGGFILAQKAGVPIIPVTIDGSVRIMPKGERTVHGGTIELTIHPPVPSEGIGSAEREALISAVQQPIADTLGEAS